MKSTRCIAYSLSLLLISLAACGQRNGAVQTPASAIYQIFVTNELSNDLTIIDGATHKVSATIPIGHRPRGIRASADGKTLFIALSGSPIAPPGSDEKTLPPPDPNEDGIAMFDIASRRIVKVLKGIPNPEQIAIGADGMVYAASEANDTLEAVDSNSGEIKWRVAVDKEPEGIAISPDGKSLYVTSESTNSIAVIDVATQMVAAKLPVGDRPRSVAFASDGARAYATGEIGKSLNVIDARRHTLLNTIHLTGEGLLPMGVTVSPDSKQIYITTGRGGALIVVDAVTGAQKLLAVGQRPWGVAISPDGRYAYTANGPSNDVAVVDTATLAVVDRLKAGTRPWGAVAVPVAPAR